MIKKIREFGNKKYVKIAKSILNVFIIMFVIGFFISVILQRVSDNKLSFFSYRMFTVISESMVPKYKINDVLIAKEVEPSKIKVGDDISYTGRKGDLNNKVVTHQVVGIEKGEDNKYKFRTRGLANIVEDPIIDEDQILGKIVYKPWTLSLIYKIIGTNVGFLLFIIIPIMFIIGSEIISILLEKEEKRRAQ